MEKEKYVNLFKSVVGRELTPQEFLKAKESDFDPKQIKQIAGLTEEVVSDSVTDKNSQVNNETAQEITEKKENSEQPSLEDTQSRVSQTSKPISKKKVPTKLIITVVVILILAASIFGFVKTRPVNVTKDVEVTFSGYEGYGNASYNSKILNQVIMQRLAVKAGFSKAESQNLITMSSASNYLTNEKYRSKTTKLVQWISDLKISLDAGSNLKNDDKVTFKLKPGKGTPLKAIDKTYKVKGLKKPEKTTTDKLSKGEITFSGYNGNGSVEYNTNKFKLLSKNKSGNLSNGEELNFQITEDYIDTLIRKGKTISEKTFKVKVSDLKEMNSISKVDTLYNKIPDLVKKQYQDKPAGEYGSVDLTYKIEPQKSFIKVSDGGYNDKASLSLVISYKITKTQTWVKDDTSDNKKKGEVTTEEIFTYSGYQNVDVYKNALVLSNLYEVSGSPWSKYLDIDAVYAELDKSGYGEYQPKV